MSRTFRRKNQKHEYAWVLKNWDTFLRGRLPFTIVRNHLPDAKQLQFFIQMHRSLWQVQHLVGIGGDLSIGAVQETTGS